MFTSVSLIRALNTKALILEERFAVKHKDIFPIINSDIQNDMYKKNKSFDEDYYLDDLILCLQSIIQNLNSGLKYFKYIYKPIITIFIYDGQSPWGIPKEVYTTRSKKITYTIDNKEYSSIPIYNIEKPLIKPQYLKLIDIIDNFNLNLIFDLITNPNQKNI